VDSKEITMVSRWKTFEGKRYLLHGIRESRKAADNIATGLRNLDFNARVVSASDKSWAVYRRRR